MNKNTKECNKPNYIYARVIDAIVLDFHYLPQEDYGEVISRYEYILLFNLPSFSTEVQVLTVRAPRYTMPTAYLPLKSPQVVLKREIELELKKIEESIILKRTLLYLTLVVFSYTAGVYSFSQQLWPINAITAQRNAAAAKALSSNYDKLGAFSNLAKKVEVPCPTQNASTSVLLVLGQSNSANHAEKKNVSKYPNKVLNYYMGKCYSAESPLLGASGLEGEYVTLIGDALIKKGNLSNVILVNKSIGGSTVSDWGTEGPLNSDLVTTLNTLNLSYRVTHVIWHQGESDFARNTPLRKYQDSFEELKLVLSENSVKAPIFLVVSTICGYNSSWIAQNPVAIAQKSLIDNKNIFLGIDADSTLLATDRRAQSPSQEPNCHLTGKGQMKVARLISNKILEFNNFQASR